MLAIPDTWTQDLETFPSDLKMPYTLTPGRAAGAVLSEAKTKRLVGARFPGCTVTVPAQDFCPLSGDSDPELVLAPTTGTLTGFTETAGGVIGTIRIDGSDTDMVHRITGADLANLEINMRVEAVWSDDETATGILAIKGFRPAPNAPIGDLRPLDNPSEPVQVVDYRMDLHYEHAFGPYYGRLFDEIKTNRRIMGVRTSDGAGALLPPREIDDVTHRKTGTWVEVGQTGTVRAMSVIHLEFIGQTQPPPYIYAEIILDGALTRLIHNVRIDDMDKAKEQVRPGTRVRAVWRDAEPTGSMSDISHFEVIEDQS
jgi:uncharacterized OB-fold protein